MPALAVRQVNDGFECRPLVGVEREVIRQQLHAVVQVPLGVQREMGREARLADRPVGDRHRRLDPLLPVGNVGEHQLP